MILPRGGNTLSSPLFINLRSTIVLSACGEPLSSTLWIEIQKFGGEPSSSTLRRTIVLNASVTCKFAENHRPQRPQRLAEYHRPLRVEHPCPQCFSHMNVLGRDIVLHAAENLCPQRLRRTIVLDASNLDQCLRRTIVLNAADNPRPRRVTYKNAMFLRRTIVLNAPENHRPQRLFINFAENHRPRRSTSINVCSIHSMFAEYLCPRR